jgi:hypothetical protein
MIRLDSSSKLADYVTHLAVELLIGNGQYPSQEEIRKMRQTAREKILTGTEDPEALLRYSRHRAGVENYISRSKNELR